METQRLPSLCAAVIKDGKTQFEECFGYSNIEKKTAATPDTMHAIASMTKPLTATGLMTLVERRLVDPDRPANDYLGEAKLVAYVGSASGATVRRLLHCTSGLPERLNIFYANEKWTRPPMEQSIRRYGILVSAPGEVYTYSNFSYAVLEHIIERVTGQEYAAFMKTQVLEPLGMTRTAVLTQSPSDDSVAVKYDGTRQPLALSDYDRRGASAAYASLRDVVKQDSCQNRRFVVRNASCGTRPST
jgi:CubicO group peptidase (beta-lactamase class C family)